MISSEPAYARMVIPYWMAGAIEESHVLTANDEYYHHSGVVPHLGKSAVGVDPNAKTVTLAGGETIPFDTLLVATGSSATKPPIPGADLAGVRNLWTLDDARSVMSRATP